VQLQQVSVKFPATLAGAGPLDQERLIPIFHRWIQEHRLPGVLLIDVADYRHVPDGPGVMLIADGAHYGLDEGGGQLGLRYARRRDPVGDGAGKLREALRAALTACVALEQDPTLAGELRFPADRVVIEVVSRLVAANTAETFAAFEPLVREVLSPLHGGGDLAVDRVTLDERAPFGVEIRASAAPGAAALLAKLG
jgi:hypothetical protein